MQYFEIRSDMFEENEKKTTKKQKTKNILFLFFTVKPEFKQVPIPSFADLIFRG